MPKRIEVAPTAWAVEDSMIRNPETGERLDVRQVILVDPISKDRYIFPMPPDQAKEFGETLMADDADAKMEEIGKRQEARRKLSVQGKPSEADLKRMSRMGRGEAIERP